MSSIIQKRKINAWLMILFLGSSVFQIQCGATKSNNHQELGWETGDIYTDEQDWLEARAGNMPLVITAPHGGTLMPDDIPDRGCQGITTVRDMDTTELAFSMEQALNNQYGRQPFVIAAHISRRKIDLNRDKPQATCGNETMEQTWYQYHEFVEGAISKAVDEFGWALYIDLHGHGHEIQRLELGYLLGKDDLRNTYFTEDNHLDLAKKSSVNNLLEMNPDATLKDLLTGEYAFGSLMEEKGIASVPGMQDPYPGSDEAYFTGGYNTRRYTSEDYPAVFGWQIEANRTGIRDTEENRKAFAKAFADAIMNFTDHHIN